MKRAFTLLLSILLFSVFSAGALAAPTYNTEVDVMSGIYYLKSMNDGTVLFSQNADVPCSPAGLLNVVTASVVLNNVADPANQTMTVPQNISSMVGNTGSATMFLSRGESVRVLDLLYSILIRSAADSSITLAQGVAGSVEAFVDMMNEYVRALGCANTHFVNVTGLDAEGQYTTAEDMAIIMQAASENALFREITMTAVYQFQATQLYDERRIFTTNLMIQSGYPAYYYQYLTSIKAGQTSQAGKCVAATATKDGYSYVAVVMRGPEEGAGGTGQKKNFAFVDCKTLLSWTFRNIKLCEVANPTQTVGELPVRYSYTTDHVRLVPAGKLSMLLPAKADTDSVIFRILDDQTEDEVKAPCPKGEIVGKAEVVYGEQVIEVINIATGDDLPFELRGVIVGVAKDAAHSPVLLLLVLAIAAFIVIYFFLGVRYDKKLRKFRVIRGGKTRKRGGK